MVDELKESDFDEARTQQVRSETREMMEQLGLSAAKASRDIGVGQSTLTAWLAGNYAGANAKVAVQAQRWLNARRTHAETVMRAPNGPAYVRTRTSEAFVNVFEHAQYAPDFAVIVGQPGLGKTTTARAYVRTAHNTWMITCQPSMATISAVVTELGETLGIVLPGNGLSISSACRQIVKRLSGLQALLLVDEAQHLSAPALDQLRSIHDLAGCGVVLMGNPAILRNLEGGRRSADFAQLFSRVGQRLVRHQPALDDIEAILNGWGIEDAAVRRVARAVARRPGALRAMDKVLRQAHMRAAAEGVALGEAHMVASVQALGDDKPLEIAA